MYTCKEEYLILKLLFFLLGECYLFIRNNKGMQTVIIRQQHRGEGKPFS